MEEGPGKGVENLTSHPQGIEGRRAIRRHGEGHFSPDLLLSLNGDELTDGAVRKQSRGMRDVGRVGQQVAGGLAVEGGSGLRRSRAGGLRDRYVDLPSPKAAHDRFKTAGEFRRPGCLRFLFSRWAAVPLNGLSNCWNDFGRKGMHTSWSPDGWAVSGET